MRDLFRAWTTVTYVGSKISITRASGAHYLSLE